MPTTLPAHQMIAIALRRQKHGTGSSPEFLRQRTAVIQFPNLNDILYPLLWCVVGAGATRLYMPERMTNDLDILILSSDETEAHKCLKQAGYAYQGQLTLERHKWISPKNFPVDVLLGTESWVKSALETAQSNRDGQGLPILPLPYLVLMKFQAGRVQDIADVARMLGQAPEPQIFATRQLFQKWLPSDLEDFDSLVLLGQLEN